jgi:type I restriction enzyme S subunit
MSEWEVKPLAEIADIKVSNVDKKSFSGELPVRLCNYMDVYAGRYLGNGDRYMEATCTPRELAAFGLRRGDVLITKDSESPDDIAIPALIDDDVQELVCGYHLAVLRLRSDALDPVVLLKQLESERLRRYFGQRAGGSTRYGLSTRAIAQAPILVPPEEAQRSIVETHRSIDTQITHTEALIAKQEQVRAGLMQDLFTRGVDETGRLRPPREEAPELYHETALGRLPKGWEASTLLKLIPRAVYGSSEALSDDPQGVSVLRMNNIQTGKFDVAELRYSTKEPPAFLMLKAGDLLFNRTNSMEHVGKVALWRDELPKASFASYLVRLDVDQSLIQTEFMLYWLNMPTTQLEMRRYATPGVHQVNINPTSLRRLICAHPTDLTEQSRIIDRVATIDGAIEADRAFVLKLRNQRFALLHDLLTPPAAASTVPRIAAE